MSNGPDFRLYNFWGVDLGELNGSNQYVTDCPFCDHARHFYIDADTSMYQCKDSACGASGNPYTFLASLYQQSLEQTVPFHYRKLAYYRNRFHQGAYEGQVAFSKELGCYLIPQRNAKGAICGLGKYTGNGPVFGSPGCSQHLYGIDIIAPTGPIFICEGQWDRYALLWLLGKCREAQKDITILGAPGASNIPKADLELLAGRDVYLLYDNDDAGRNGAKTACKKLAGVVNSLYILDWPKEDRFPDKYDVEDYVREGTLRPDKLWEDLISWCYKYQKGANLDAPVPKLRRTTFASILKDYADTGIHMYPGLTDFLAITAAVVYSTNLDGEPLWMYGIGDPGRGKSLVLESTLGSNQCVYRTSVTHKAFISGFRDTGGDNSLLALLPGKALIVKDYSNVLSLPHVEQEQLVSLLREAYDGKIVRSWGNGVYREYPPADSPHKDCRFAVVAGVTKEIHARSHAGLGERFLKYEIPCTEEDNILAMEAALDDSWKSHERQLPRGAAVGSFLDRHINFTELPKVPSWYKKRIIALSTFVGLSRSPVSRTRGDLDYSPSPESGTRVAKQLLKLSQSLCYVFNLTEPNEECYRLIRKVAWDTSHGWRRDLFIALYHEDNPLNTHQVTEAASLSLGTCHRQLHDMRALKTLIAKKEDNHMSWLLNNKAREIISIAGLEKL